MRYVLGTVIGFALLAFGLTCLCYGIAQAIEIGSCGTDRYGRSVGPTCPSGTGGMIGMMVGGAFISIFGSGFLAIRGRPGESTTALGFGAGIAVGQLMFWLGAIVAGGLSVYFAITDLHEDDTRPGMEIVYVVAGTLAAFALIGSLLGARRKQTDGGRGGRAVGPRRRRRRWRADAGDLRRARRHREQPLRRAPAAALRGRVRQPAATAVLLRDADAAAGVGGVRRPARSAVARSQRRHLRPARPARLAAPLRRPLGR